MATTQTSLQANGIQQKTMKAVQVSKSGGEFELMDKPIPEPGPRQVRIQVKACGICHSDKYVKDGGRMPVTYPRTPGHEVAGLIDQLGEGVKKWKIGQKVGVGWHGGHCFTCDPCREGDFINCVNGKITGISFDGGYAEYMIVPDDAVAAIPENLSFEEAAPLLCAGITTYNSLRNSGARAGDLVAIQGIGGLGHLAIQFSHQMGFQTVAISGDADKKQLAHELGADFYIDGSTQDTVRELKKLGGAKVILATAPSSKLISPLIGGLKPNGKLVIVGATSEPLEITPMQLISGRLGIQGWASGDAKDSEETLAFSAASGVRPKIEVYPLNQVTEAYQKMMDNKARFRVVLKMGD